MRRPTVQGLTSGRGILLSLVAIAAVSTILRAIVVGRIHAPTVFMDEMGYTKLAQSIGLHGRIALLDEEGFSYSPLYSLLIAPIYALGASSESAYTLIKIVNALVMSLSVFPVYGIARFVLPPRRSLLVAAVAVVAPLMSYTSFTMSENLAYLLALVAIWATLVAITTPGPKADALVLVSVLAAFAARIQLIVLFPAALTAILLAALAGDEAGAGRRLARAVRAHWLLFGVAAAGLLAAVVRGLAGGDVYSVFGRYANVGDVGFPNVWHVLELAYHHVAELEFAVGFVPFVGTLIAAFVFFRSGLPGRYVPFAAVAGSMTALLLLEVAVNSAIYEGPGLDQPRLHERLLIYAIPFFLVALFAAVEVSAARASNRVHLAAAAVVAALPAFVPFGTYVNRLIGFETIGLIPFSRIRAGELVPVHHTAVVAVLVAAVLSLTYVRVLRFSVVRTAVYVVAVFALMSVAAALRIHSASVTGRSVLPEHADWVDRAVGDGEVILVADAETLPALETAYFSLSLDRAYTLCRRALTAEFGERQVQIGPDGVIRAGSAPVQASYAVVPSRLRVRGEVLARNRDGRQVLVALAGGQLATPLSTEDSCPPAR